MVTIGVDQYLSNSKMYEHRCAKNIKKLYKYSGKCDNQKHYKSIIEAALALSSGSRAAPSMTAGFKTTTTF